MVMKYRKIKCLSLFFFCVCAMTASAVEKKSLIPQKFTYKNSQYQYDPYWRDEEIWLEANLDSDGEKEVIVAFGAIAQNSSDIQRGYFWQIYDKKGKNYQVVKTGRAGNYPCNILVYDLDNDGSNEVIVYGKSSIDINNIYVYQWNSNRFKRIYGHSTIYGIFVNLTSKKPFIEIGAPNWGKMKEPDPVMGWHYMAKPLHEIYVWNGETFSYDEFLSTAPENYKVRKVLKAIVYTGSLFDDASLLSIKDKGIFEYILMYLDNKKFYYVMPSRTNDIENIKYSILPGVKLKMKDKQDGGYLFNILFDQEVEFMGKYDPSKDGFNPVHVFK